MIRVRTLLAALAASIGCPAIVHANENAIGFWVPGQQGSFAETPGTPGWSWATVYYHTSVEAGAGARVPRGGRVDVGLQGRGDLVLFGPSGTFETPCSAPS